MWKIIRFFLKSWILLALTNKSSAWLNFKLQKQPWRKLSKSESTFNEWKILTTWLRWMRFVWAGLYTQTTNNKHNTHKYTTHTQKSSVKMTSTGGCFFPHVIFFSFDLKLLPEKSSTPVFLIRLKYKFKYIIFVCHFFTCFFIQRCHQNVEKSSKMFFNLSDWVFTHQIHVNIKSTSVTKTTQERCNHNVVYFSRNFRIQHLFSSDWIGSISTTKKELFL